MTEGIVTVTMDISWEFVKNEEPEFPPNSGDFEIILIQNLHLRNPEMVQKKL